MEMTKKEEMAAFIHGKRDKSGSEKTAKALVEAGYGKVDEYKSEIERLKAVKEFAEWVKDHITDVPFCNQKAYNIFCDMVNEKLKEYEK